ncbi:carbohydrate sulfotransferase 8-like isoform 1-T3 [Synchiropus picturatus]
MWSSCSAHRSVWMLVLLGATSLLLVCMQARMALQISGLKIRLSQSGPADRISAAARPDEATTIQPATTSDLPQTNQTLPDAPGGDAEKLQEWELESRRHLIRSVCTKMGYPDVAVLRHHVSRVFVENRYKLLYCEVPKAGCSNWKRVLMVLGGSASSARLIPHDEVHYGNHLKQLDSYPRDAITDKLRSYTKVLFVREPFQRLVSAFRDKFENPNPYYHSVFGRAIISRYRANATQAARSSGDGVTFREFVQYLLDVRRPAWMDSHWQPVAHLCSPCLLKYDFIGKFERLEEEADHLLRNIGAPATLTFPHLKDRDPLAARTSAAITHSYLNQLNGTERQKLYELYYLDYLMFNYTKPL